MENWDVSVETGLLLESIACIAERTGRRLVEGLQTESHKIMIFKCTKFKISMDNKN